MLMQTCLSLSSCIAKCHLRLFDPVRLCINFDGLFHIGAGLYKACSDFFIENVAALFFQKSWLLRLCSYKNIYNALILLIFSNFNCFGNSSFLVPEVELTAVF